MLRDRNRVSGTSRHGAHCTSTHGASDAQAAGPACALCIVETFPRRRLPPARAKPRGLQALCAASAERPTRAAVQLTMPAVTWAGKTRTPDTLNILLFALGDISTATDTGSGAAAAVAKPSRSAGCQGSDVKVSHLIRATCRASTARRKNERAAVAAIASDCEQVAVRVCVAEGLQLALCIGYSAAPGMQLVRADPSAQSGRALTARVAALAMRAFRAAAVCVSRIGAAPTREFVVAALVPWRFGPHCGPRPLCNRLDAKPA